VTATRLSRNVWVGLSAGRSDVKSQPSGKDLPRLGPNLSEPADDAEDQGAHGGFDGQPVLAGAAAIIANRT